MTQPLIMNSAHAYSFRPNPSVEAARMVNFSSACCARAVGTAYEPVLVPVVREQVETDRQTHTHTHTHTDTQTKYCNPRCACAPRVKTKWRD